MWGGAFGLFWGFAVGWLGAYGICAEVSDLGLNPGP